MNFLTDSSRRTRQRLALASLTALALSFTGLPVAEASRHAKKTTEAPAPAPAPKIPEQANPLSPVSPPAVAAKAWLLMDYGSGQVLASQNPDERIEPASLTKLMTAYLTFSAVKGGSLALDQVIPVSEKAWKTSGSRMFVQPGRPVTVHELMHGMIIQSGNDACVALAEAIAGSEEAFAQMMTREAARLGMKNTRFQNATGLTVNEHYTTVRDLGLLAAAIVRDFPEFYPIYGKRDYTYNRITQPNRNRLLGMDASVDGMKTGHTDAAGFNLVASAKREQRRLISVVVGTASDVVRAEESEKLLNYGFQAFESVKVYSKGQAVSRLPVWRGQADTVAGGFNEDFVISLPKGQAARLRADAFSRETVSAPVQRGVPVGTLRLMLDGKVYGEYPLLAQEEVPQAGWLGRTLDDFKLWIKSF